MKKGLIALSPLILFILLYLVTSIIVQDFYKVPIIVAFMISSIYAVAISKHIPLANRIQLYSKGASTENMMLMIWIFILAGAFANAAKEMGSIDATVNLTLSLLPSKMLLAGLFVAACFISISIGTSVGTIVALTPIAAGIALSTHANMAMVVGVIVGGAFFGDNLSFISDTTLHLLLCASSLSISFLEPTSPLPPPFPTSHTLRSYPIWLYWFAPHLA